jgi:hypothetical protein
MKEYMGVWTMDFPLCILFLDGSKYQNYWELKNICHGQRHIIKDRQPSAADCPKELKLCTVRHKIFLLGRLEQSRQKKNLMPTSTTNHPRKNPFHLYSLSPNSPQFQPSAGPLLSRKIKGSFLGWFIGLFVRVQEIFVQLWLL